MVGVDYRANLVIAAAAPDLVVVAPCGYHLPGAIERLEPALWNRLVLTQQVREEDVARVRAVYDRLKINAELAPFFSDLPARLASSHLVISRSGAGTVAEHLPNAAMNSRRSIWSHPVM